MAKSKYKVLRPHIGDKEYSVGEIREAEESAVAHLEGKVLKKMSKSASNKAAQKPQNKAG